MTAKIAIIGAGISGMTAAYLLNRKHDICLFEINDRLGGHTATVDFELDGSSYAIDTGFIVYNDWTYPNFIKLLEQLGVDTQPTSMGFSVSCQKTGLEYAGNNLNTLFAQRKNVFSPSFLKMLKDILRFNRNARRDLENMSIGSDMTLGEYLKKNGYSDEFSEFYLVPMGAAIWSASLASMKAFPIHFFVQFFHNHGLLNIFNRPQWRVISGGSKSYIAPLTASYSEKIQLNAKIVSVKRKENCVELQFASGESQMFDQVVFATHSDKALALLADPSEKERTILRGIPYSDNSVILHHDENLLPKNRLTWSSWNYLLGNDADTLPVVTYDMNILQAIQADRTFCVSLNAEDLIEPSKIIGKYRYAHPQFSLEGIQSQARWLEINGVNKTWFCGAYWANGFHEDGVSSALRVAEHFGEFL